MREVVAAHRSSGRMLPPAHGKDGAIAPCGQSMCVRFARVTHRSRSAIVQQRRVRSAIHIGQIELDAVGARPLMREGSI